MRRRSAERSNYNEDEDCGDTDNTNMMHYEEDDRLTQRPAPRDRRVNWVRVAVVGTIAIVVLLLILAISSSGGSKGDIPALKASEPSGPFHADAIIVVGDTGVKIGSLTLDQETNGGPVTIEGEITGLSPNAKHGFHVHAFGDLRQGCNSTGTHFNPFGVTHGGPMDAVRHAGDLGNVETDSTGTAKVKIMDAKISLAPGVTCIIGRALVVHSGVDDLGRGGTPDSLTTGNAGKKYGCGVIGITS